MDKKTSLCPNYGYKYLKDLNELSQNYLKANETPSLFHQELLKEIEGFCDNYFNDFSKSKSDILGCSDL